MKKIANKVLTALLALTVVFNVFPILVSAQQNFTELEISDYYGRCALSKMDRGDTYVEAYDRIYNCIENRNEKVNLYDLKLSESELSTVVCAYERDPSCHFWSEWNYMYIPSGSYVAEFHPVYNSLASLSESEFSNAISTVESTAKSIIRSAGVTEGMSEYQKELRIHNALALYIDYTQTENCRNLYGALVEKSAVCQGYTLAFQYLLRLVGIQAHAVKGFSNGSAHSWNIVRIDGEYYQTDLTWNDPAGTKRGDSSDIYHYYFNVTNSQIGKDHAFEYPAPEYGLPDCTAEAANYYVQSPAHIVNTDSSFEDIASLFDTNGYGKLFISENNAADFINYFLDNFYPIGQLIGFDMTKSISISYANENNEYHFYLEGTMLKESPMSGDIDGDGILSAIDSNLLKRFVSGRTAPTEEQKAVGDIDKDQALTGIDSNLLKRIIAGN